MSCWRCCCPPAAVRSPRRRRRRPFRRRALRSRFKAIQSRAQGATWTYRGSLQGVTFDLQGILLKPAGTRAVWCGGAQPRRRRQRLGLLAEHRRWRCGDGGSSASRTNYTHAGNVPIGAPGTANEPGASDANVLRGHAVREILRTLGYVDQSRVAAHGHSMGAFVTTALVGAYPNDFRVASHTAGGVRRAERQRRSPERDAGTGDPDTVSAASWRPGCGRLDHAGSAPRRDPAGQPRSPRVPRLRRRRSRRCRAERDGPGANPKLVRSVSGAVASDRGWSHRAETESRHAVQFHRCVISAGNADW